jgi:hypothetical protein
VVSGWRQLVAGGLCEDGQEVSQKSEIMGQKSEINSSRDLPVWQKGMAPGEAVYWMTQAHPVNACGGFRIVRTLRRERDDNLDRRIAMDAYVAA